MHFVDNSFPLFLDVCDLHSLQSRLDFFKFVIAVCGAEIHVSFDSNHFPLSKTDLLTPLTNVTYRDSR